ncbi:MAG: outer rane efflux protein [Bryobacterales bacterium]|jgi:outer membrane protein|nr:outer rane efflux protein [Bryobacterales bacterium]
MSLRPPIGLIVLLFAGGVFAQSAPASPDRPWHSPSERHIEDDAKRFREPGFSIEPDRVYSLAELVDLAEEHNPETRVAWERARAQAAALGVARSELYPTIAAVALSQTDREQVPFGSQFYRQTVQTFEGALELNYTIFDFGGRAGRIAAAGAELVAANFAFNNTHRKIIYQVAQAYYRLLNASGQQDAALASLANAQTAQQAAEDRLKQGLATLPDVLEARSATAQAQYDLQAVLGAEEIASGDLATALGTRPTVVIHVQPLGQLPIPESVANTVDQAIDRAFDQRPDLMQQLAEIRRANAGVMEARAAFQPTLTLSARPNLQSLYFVQQTLPWAHTADVGGNLSVNLSWTLLDGGKRKNNLARAEASVRAAEAQVSASRDQIADEVWRAYSNVKTALRQRQAAIALLEAANQSYAAVLESYNFGVRSFLDVTAAQRTLAQARSADVLARTQVLTTLVDLAFGTGSLIR